MQQLDRETPARLLKALPDDALTASASGLGCQITGEAGALILRLLREGLMIAPEQLIPVARELNAHLGARYMRAVRSGDIHGWGLCPTCWSAQVTESEVCSDCGQELDTTPESEAARAA